MVQKILWLGLAGAIGTLARYWATEVVGKIFSGDFPFGTAIVNIAGCLLFGLSWAVLENRLSVSSQMRMIVFVGFFGAFTTFSTFVFETARLGDESKWLWSFSNLILQNSAGLMCLSFGLRIGRLV